jgi:nucleotide-binding universal stress UspA family protein
MVASRRPARVLVAIDGSPDGRRALELAAMLAAQWLEAGGDGGAGAAGASASAGAVEAGGAPAAAVELCGVYVEDDALRGAAALPFVHEIALHSARTRRLTLGELEPRLERIAGQLRDAVEAAARESSVAWSFAVRRGRMARVGWEMTGEADWVVVGGHSLGPSLFRSGIGAGARRKVEPPPLLVVHDGSPASARLLEHAARLAVRRRARLEVYRAAPRESPDTTPRAEWQRRVVSELAALAELGAAGTVHPTALRTTADLLAAARVFRPQLILLPAASGLVDESMIERLVLEQDCPIALRRENSPEG